MIRRYKILLLSLLTLTLMTSPALAQKEGKGSKDKARQGHHMKDKKEKHGEDKKEGKGKHEHDGEGKHDGDAKHDHKHEHDGEGTHNHAGKDEAPGQIKKETGEHPGGKARGKKEHIKAFKKDDLTSKEELKHLERLAKIDRLEEIGKKNNNEKLTAKAAELRKKEHLRHEKKRSKLAQKNTK